MPSDDRSYTVSILPDESAPSPEEGDYQWEIIPFVASDLSACDWFDGVDAFGDVIPEDDDLRKKLETGLAFLLCSDSRQGGWELLHCLDTFDLEDIGGLILWNHAPSDMGGTDYQSRRQDAESFLETYNDWCQGAVYGYAITENGTEEVVESCWNFYDAQYMTNEIFLYFNSPSGEIPEFEVNDNVLGITADDILSGRPADDGRLQRSAP